MSKKPLPRVAIVGKRNAGKSTLLNTLVGKSRAITDATPGLTRDILQVEIHREPLRFILCDTPGLDLDGDQPLDAAIIERTRGFLEEVDLILFLMEPPAPTPFDVSFLNYFRTRKDLGRVVFILNKIDSPGKAEAEGEFYREGFPELLLISAIGRTGLNSIYDAIEERLPGALRGAATKGSDCVAAIVGKPNAGKSSLLNRLSGKDLALVSEIPGTTRDSIDSIFTFHGKTIRLIDTAGLKKTGKIKDNVEFYSMSRTKRAVSEAEVVIHVLDAQMGITDFDKKIVSLTESLGKPAIFAVNKWDAVEERDQKAFLDRMYFMFPHAKVRPVIFISAKTGLRTAKVIEETLELKERASFRVPTARLNQWLAEWNKKLASSPKKARIYYGTQAASSPPEFIFFVNKKDHFRPDVMSYFENRIREDCNLAGVPISIKLREKES